MIYGTLRPLFCTEIHVKTPCSVYPKCLKTPFLELVERRILRLALLYKIVHGDVAIPANEFLISSDERTRAPHEFKFRHIGANIDSFRYSFFPRTIRDWDLLSDNQVSSETVEAFKSSLKADPPPDPNKHH